MMNNNEMMMNMVQMMMQNQMQSQQMMMQMMMSMMQAPTQPTVSAPQAPSSLEQVQGSWQASADPQTIKAQQTPNEKPAKGKDKKFPPLGKPVVIGKNITVYDGTKVRWWEIQDFTPSKVSFAIKSSLREAGAKWDKESGAYRFNTKKDCTAWCKAQAEREDKKSA